MAFVLLGGLYLLIDQLRESPGDLRRVALRCGLFTAGAAIPYGLTCLILALAGVFDNFWFWTVDYALAYTTQVPIEQAWLFLKSRVVRIGSSAPLIWALVFIGLTAFSWDKQARRQSIFIALFTLFSLAAICPGFYFRPHYFVLILPAAALLSGVAISGMANVLSNVRSRIVQYGLPLLLAAFCLVASIYNQRHFLFQMTPVEACHATYSRFQPFTESLEIARFIRAHTKENDRIAVIGSEPQIYFYSCRRSASGYIYMYPLMENHGFALQMQKEMIREIESVKPRLLIFVRNNTSWLRRPDSHTLVSEWFQRYQKEHYSLVGLVDSYKGETYYHWTPNVKWPPRSSYWIAVLKESEKRNQM